RKPHREPPQPHRLRPPTVLKPSGILTSSAISSHGSSAISSHGSSARAAEKTYYSEPADAVVPTGDTGYHLFKFNDRLKTEEEVPLANYKSYLVIGRDSTLADIVIDKETEDGDVVSRRHAVIQFRKGGTGIKAYLLDLGSSNGSFLNGTEVPPKRYIELRDGDRMRFGDDRGVVEFVLLVGAGGHE
ncbi:DEKNAAC103939, partial [Brettanomyces naardenensis]